MAVIDQKMGVVLQGEYEGYNVYIHVKNKSLEFVENVQPGWFSAPTPKIFIVDSTNIHSYRLISTHQESGASDISIGAAYLFVGRGAANSVKNAVQITMHKVEIVFNNGKRCLVDLKGDAFSTLETLCYTLNASNSTIESKTSTIDSASIDKNIEAVKKFKELLDMGIITQEEFDQKKKQLLGLEANVLVQDSFELKSREEPITTKNTSEDSSSQKQALVFILPKDPNCKIACQYMDEVGYSYKKLMLPEYTDLCKKYDIKRLPTLLLIDGDKFEKIYGAAAIKQYVSTKK